MRVRTLVGFAALGGVLAVASFAIIGNLSIELPDLAEGDDTAAFVARSVAEAKQDRFAGFPIAQASIVDPLLLDPQPMQPADDQPLQSVALAFAPPAASAAGEATAAVSSVAAAPGVKRTIPPPRLEKDGSLNVEQIVRIKQNLNLTREQEQHWAPVEAELRAIARQMAA